MRSRDDVNEIEQLDPYMVWLKGSRSMGAALAFAGSGKDARKLGWPVMQTWWEDATFFGMRARKMPRRADLMRQATDAGPHVIESPKTCEICEYWGGEPLDGGGCSLCGGEQSQ